MLKEIHEQPAALEKLVRTRIIEHGEPGSPGTAPKFDLDGLRLDTDYARDLTRIVLMPSEKPSTTPVKANVASSLLSNIVPSSR